MNNNQNNAPAASSLRKEIFDAGRDALKSQGDALRDHISAYKGQGKSMDPADSLQLQFMVGEYSNLVQAITGIEKMMKDAITSATRNAAS